MRQQQFSRRFPAGECFLLCFFVVGFCHGDSVAELRQAFQTVFAFSVLQRGYGFADAADCFALYEQDAAECHENNSIHKQE